MRVPAIPDSGALQSIDNHRGQGISYSGSHANRYWECLRHVRYQWEWRCCPLRIQGPARYSGSQCSQGSTCRGVVLPCRKKMPGTRGSTFQRETGVQGEQMLCILHVNWTLAVKTMRDSIWTPKWLSSVFRSYSLAGNIGVTFIPR